MNWDDLKLFLAVHRAGSVRGAARHLGLDHSTVSRRLTRFQTACGGVLFDQTSAGYVLNAPGAAVLAEAERAERAILAVHTVAAGTDQGLEGAVRITLPDAVLIYLLQDSLSAITAEQPGIRLEINPTNRLERLDRREADIAIRAAGTVEPDYLVGRKTGVIHRAAFARPDAGPDLPWLGMLSDPETPVWLSQSAFPERPVKHRSGNTLADLVMTRAGLGVGFFPCFVGDQCSDLVRVGGLAPQPGHGLWVLLHPDVRRSPRIRFVADRIFAALASKRGLIEGRGLDIG